MELPDQPNRAPPACPMLPPLGRLQDCHFGAQRGDSNSDAPSQASAAEDNPRPCPHQEAASGLLRAVQPSPAPPPPTLLQACQFLGLFWGGGPFPRRSCLRTPFPSSGPLRPQKAISPEGPGFS